jgi:hypothetical protein
VRSRRESTVLNEEVPHIHCVINASVQLMIATEVIDANDESFSSRHGCPLRGLISGSRSSK